MTGNCFLISGENARAVPPMVTVSGIALSVLPPCIWQKLTSARTRAKGRAERPIDKGRDETLLKRFERNLAATERMGGPLADVIQRERAYLDQLAALESERARWERVGKAARQKDTTL